MRQVVIDTNVVISSVLSPNGKPSEILKLCFSGLLQVVCSESIISEYKRVLAYKKLNIAVETQVGLLNAIEEVSVLIKPIKSLSLMTDEDDRIFYDAATARNAALITGNKIHYPNEPHIKTPTEFLESLEVEFEEYAHKRYVAAKLAEAEAEAVADPKRISHEEFWQEFGL